MIMPIVAEPWLFHSCARLAHQNRLTRLLDMDQSAVVMPESSMRTVPVVID
jgi:hypothetical protein